MISLILSDTDRSLFYLKEIVQNNIHINKIIVYSKDKKILSKFIRNNKLDKLTVYCKTNTINASIINNRLEAYKSKINVISTYPGEIVENKNILKKNLMHCHPGDLPKFKGSTTIYYSIILKKRICVTIFLINAKIDNGKILYKKFFNYPKNFKEIEKNFDNKIRAKTLVEYLKSNKKHNFKKIKDNYLPYYIAHPIIREIVISKKI